MLWWRPYEFDRMQPEGYDMSERIIDKNESTAVTRPIGRWVDIVGVVLATVAVAASAFHFWPFAQSKAWQMLCPSNLAVLAGSGIVAPFFLLRRTRRKVAQLLPHASVFAYLGVAVLSIAFAASAARAVAFTAKLVLMLIGGYALLNAAIANTRRLRTIYAVTAAAAFTSVACAVLARFVFGSDGFGFFDNAYKYGTYVGILTPLCSGYLFASGRVWARLLAAFLLIGAAVSSGSLGALATITAGMAAFAVFSGWSAKLCVAGCLVCGVGLVVLFHSNPAFDSLKQDVRLAEKDRVNLKQRYIEWQAEINLLLKLSLSGTGAGCINDERSSFYGRLPKLNTLAAFDQNGWLATAAETGILGLVCFCWVVSYYGRSAWRQIRQAGADASNPAGRFALANFAGLVAACVANLFSSVHYNGILLVFVLLLVLISRTGRLFGDIRCASESC